MAVMPWTMCEHANTDQLAAACAARIDAELDIALRERGAALLALAGGRTSPPVFRRLAVQFRDWSRVTILPSDERWVAADHPDCNLRQMREAFAGAEGIRWLSLVPALPQGEASAAFANGALAPYPQPFDVCIAITAVVGRRARRGRQQSGLFVVAHGFHRALRHLGEFTDFHG